MTANTMRERANDCYQRAARARRAASLANEPSREWLLRMSEQWTDLARQYEAAAPKADRPLANLASS